MIHLGWNMCKVIEDIHIPQCKNCYRFNHKTSECSYEVSCDYCGLNHHIKDCSSATLECVNCKYNVEVYNDPLNTDHRADSLECASVQHKMRQARLKISYL